MTDEAVVRAWLAAVGRDPRALRLATRDLHIELPDGTQASGRPRALVLAARIGLRSRGTLRMTPLALESVAPGEVCARTRTTARARGRRLDLEMTIRFRVRDGQVCEMAESADDLAAWRAFWH